MLLTPLHHAWILEQAEPKGAKGKGKEKASRESGWPLGWCTAPRRWPSPTAGYEKWVSQSERERERREEKRREFVDHIEETCPCRSTGDSTCWLPFLAESSGETRNRPPPHLRSALLPTRAMGRAKEKRRQRWVGDSLNERMGVLDLRKKGV